MSILSFSWLYSKPTKFVIVSLLLSANLFEENLDFKLYIELLEEFKEEVGYV